MKKMLKRGGYVALGLVLLFAIGYGANSHSTATEREAQSDVLAFPDDGVTMALDKALSRNSTGGAGAVLAAPQGAGPSSGSLPAVPSASEAAKPAQTGKQAADAGNAAASPGDPGALAPGLASVDDRKIVQTASLNLQVKDVGGVFQEVGQIATAAGGFVAASNFALQGEQQIATATLRVPAVRYQDVLGQIRALGVKVEAQTSNASDVSQEYTDLDARRRTLEATQSQLLQLLGQAKTIGETLQVQDRLNTTQTQIEQLKGRMQLLDKLSDFATLTVHLRPVAVPLKTATSGVDLGARVSEAWDHSLVFLGNIAGGVLAVVVFAWWVPLFAIPTAWLLNRTRARTQASKPVQAYD